MYKYDMKLKYTTKQNTAGETITEFYKLVKETTVSAKCIVRSNI